MNKPVSPWRIRIGLTAAAFASLATSAPEGWRLDATLPPETSPPQGQAYRYKVESNSKVIVTLNRGITGRPWKWKTDKPEDAVGQGFVVFPGERIERITATGDCDGCQDDTCDPPGGASVQLLNPTPLFVSSARDEVEITVDQRGRAEGKVDFFATIESLDWVTVDAVVPEGPGTLRFEAYPESANDVSRIESVSVGDSSDNFFDVSIHATKGQSFESQRWKVAVILERLCEGTPCPAPAVRPNFFSIYGPSVEEAERTP
ncbi:hypothetical protein LVJ94_28490 [Pendulispora rubella]|uniref:Uncharacterized protein n=1 Tax=Pendulispora rubella TaxID=2741070 RepID=A0ABZ2KQB7_9BACT